ncbi:MAG: hypothetical protein J3K34DRAFT_428856 [Monoraphidium minutum]|nr:MAG: hypothetical protein J3K34DRAFT_428856 [Monoraphidium minutum]
MFSKFTSPAYLDQAATRFRVGLESNIPEDELIALELGAASLDDLSEVQRAYVDKLKARLVQRGEELRLEEEARRKREAVFFEAGKAAYERGEYPESVASFEKAVEQSGRQTAAGGDALMWLALAYQAVGREQDCIDTYKWIEVNHPLPRVRKQAENLRYIMEAPKLEIGPDERVTIPLLNSQESWRRDARKTSFKPATGSETKKEESYWDRVDWDMKIPFVPDKWYYRVLWVALIVGVTVYFNYTAISR